MGQNLVAGLTVGFNFPEGKFGEGKPWINLEGCNDVIVVDRKFFLQNTGFIHAWAVTEYDKN